METIFKKPVSMTPTVTHYCPGCTHGIIHRLIAECIDEYGIREKTVGIAPVGCADFAYNYFDCDFQEAAHGRAPALATGMKRVRPDLFVFTYQGDGDLASIGTAETIHAANRGEKFLIVFVNNAVYGMTGGQMAPTTMPGQVTTTCPMGRDPKAVGYPLRVAELLASLRTPSFIARVAVHRPRYTVKAKEILRRAFDYQLRNVCFSMVEFLSTCPTNWGKSPHEACDWLEKEMIPYYPLGVLKTPEENEDGGGR
jgi:2-oxoglutarate ferredoxin oxidoreductase subunit beta